VNLVPGELYFIRETDVLTGATSDYCKIGLVKDADQRSAAKRADEHQTGNPRLLEVVGQVHAPAISDLEATVHDRLATKRVLGEWFELPDKAALSEAVALARQLAAEQEQHLTALRLAKELSAVESTEELVAPSADDLHWLRQVHRASELEKRLKRLRKQSAEIFRSAHVSGIDVLRFAAVSPKSSRSLDTKKLAESHPEIVQQFTVVTSGFSSRFLPVKPDGDVVELDDAELRDLEGRFAALLAAEVVADHLEDLHLAHLELLGLLARASWDSEVAKVNLKAACGLASGIEGVASWKRGYRVSEGFDTEAFQAAYPDLHEQFTVATEGWRTVVRPMRSFRPRSV
jgi:hypothetical protein